MNERRESGIRTHSTHGAPPWQKRSRWFPHIDAGEALVMSSISILVIVGLIVVLIVAARLGRGAHTVFLKASVLATSNGYALVDSQTPESMWPAETDIGSFVWSRQSKARGYFGPFEVMRWPRPNVMLILEGDTAISPAAAIELASTAPNTLRGYDFEAPHGVTTLGSGDLRYRFKPGQFRFVWTGVPLNTGFWMVVLSGVWAGSWLVYSLRSVLDPRRKRARKLGVHLCPRCDYDVRLIESERCPECGELLTIEPERVGPAISE